MGGEVAASDGLNVPSMGRKSLNALAAVAS